MRTREQKAAENEETVKSTRIFRQGIEFVYDIRDMQRKILKPNLTQPKISR